MALDAVRLVLFRSDLRVNDNRALSAALAQDAPVIALYVYDQEPDLGGASRWWLHHSLTRLTESLQELCIPLVLRQGNTTSIVQELAETLSIKQVFWNRSYDAQGIEIGRTLKAWARNNDIQAESFDGALLHEPSRATTKTGSYYKVYTPFFKNHILNLEIRPPSGKPKGQALPGFAVDSDRLEDWSLLPVNPNWAESFEPLWTPGEFGAHKTLRHFLKEGLPHYDEARDVPSVAATSSLSPHLRFGEITPYQIWHEADAYRTVAGDENVYKFHSEIAWRDFAHHLLFHNPALKTENFNEKFDDFPWDNDDITHEQRLRAWQRGMTGYPIVDAGMRQLWQTGWMHNRVRMIVASFLVKHLLIDWRVGEAWFWDTLLDACPANNPASWQWVAGCGADAAPYFRIFNPILQGEKFDPDGAYVRTYLPELSKLPKKLIHKPWTANRDQLAACGVTLGKTYPHPIVDHARARQRALDAFQSLKQKAA